MLRAGRAHAAGRSRDCCSSLVAADPAARLLGAAHIDLPFVGALFGALLPWLGSESRAFQAPPSYRAAASMHTIQLSCGWRRQLDPGHWRR